MAALLLPVTSTIMGAAHNGPAVCAHHKNVLLQSLKLHNSSLQASRLKAFSKFKCMRASGSNYANSSVILATSNLHAGHKSQANHDTHTVDGIPNGSLWVGHGTQTDNNMKEPVEKKRQQAVLDFVVPDFNPPFPLSLNPGLEEANKAALKWATHFFEPIMSPENFQALFYKANPHMLAGLCYPDAPISRLEFGIEFVTWLYVLDDESIQSHKRSWEESIQMQLEIQAVIMSAFPQDQSLRENLVKCVSSELGRFEFIKDFVDNVVAQATMRHQLGAEYDEHINPIASALGDWWTRVLSIMPKEWSIRFGKVLQESVFAHFLESHNLHHKIFPSAATYILERRKSGLAPSCIHLQELFQDILIPNSIYDSLPMQRLIDAAIDAICWNNDIWSFQKEFLAGEEMANLVFLVSKEEGCSYNKAAEIVTEMVMDKCKEMQLAAIELKEYGKTHDFTTMEEDAIEYYISCCNNWISGTHKFHSQSSRFQMVHA
ncbi:unnamed protein product [Sphagnum compactum]